MFLFVFRLRLPWSKNLIVGCITNVVLIPVVPKSELEHWKSVFKGF